MNTFSGDGTVVSQSNGGDGEIFTGLWSRIGKNHFKVVISRVSFTDFNGTLVPPTLPVDPLSFRVKIVEDFQMSSDCQTISATGVLGIYVPVSTLDISGPPTYPGGNETLTLQRINIDQ